MAKIISKNVNKSNINNCININNMLQVWNNSEIVINKKTHHVSDFHPLSGNSGSQDFLNADKFLPTFWEMQFWVYKAQIKITWCMAHYSRKYAGVIATFRKEVSLSDQW